MRVTAIIISLFFLFSCSSPTTNKQKNLFDVWIKANSHKIEEDIRLFINEYQTMHKPDSNWVATSYVFTLHSPNTLGQLAKLAGDSNQCIVVELSFSKFFTEKRRIMLTAEDSSCLAKLITIDLRTDSTEYFVYGVEQKSHN